MKYYCSAKHRVRPNCVNEKSALTTNMYHTRRSIDMKLAETTQIAYEKDIHTPESSHRGIGLRPSLYRKRAENPCTEAKKRSYLCESLVKHRMEDKVNSDRRSARPTPSTYYLTRIFYLRALSLVYFVAFLVAFNQNRGLIGQDGLLPAKAYIRQLRQQHGSTLSGLREHPTLLWLLDDESIDDNLERIALAGMGLSGFVAVYGRANSFLMGALWMLYFSIDTVGQTFYSFGWESQLLETGFIAIFVCPLVSLDTWAAVSKAGVYANWWLIFRIMLGAGLIKVRGDRCWIDLTCMNFHYETQPVPNPLSKVLHLNYEWVHMLETLGNHVVELALPWLTFCARPCRIFNGLAQVAFQTVLICSGNLSFLNWLTIVPSLCFFDDQFLEWLPLFPRKMHSKANALAREKGDGSRFGRLRYLLNIGFITVVVLGSIPVVQNMIAMTSSQVMNTSFGRFKLVNSYGAFGSITKTRSEVILEGTVGDVAKLGNEGVLWSEFEFHCKPGNVSRTPCVISPYHYRLDVSTRIDGPENTV